VVAHHVVGEGADIRVLRSIERLLRGLDVEVTGRIRDMGNLRV
jgi:hypothetical protein